MGLVRVEPARSILFCSILLYTMRPAIGKQLINGIVIAIISVIVIVVLSIWQYQRIQDTGVVIKHTNQVLYQTEGVLNDAVQYEVNIKNYLLTGDSIFIQTAG